jgi:hypothetical protein
VLVVVLWKIMSFLQLNYDPFFAGSCSPYEATVGLLS